MTIARALWRTDRIILLKYRQPHLVSRRTRRSSKPHLVSRQKDLVMGLLLFWREFDLKSVTRPLPKYLGWVLKVSPYLVPRVPQIASSYLEVQPFWVEWFLSSTFDPRLAQRAQILRSTSDWSHEFQIRLTRHRSWRWVRRYTVL